MVAVLLFYYPPTVSGLLWCLGLYTLRMFGITAGYHRYFSHRSYRMARVPQFIMAFIGSTSVQKGVLWWAAHHRIHHRYSDEPRDPHSPKQTGFFWSHMGWILSILHDETHWDQIQDLAKYPELKWLNRYHVLPAILLAIAVYAIGGANALFWGMGVGTVLLWHGTFTINSLAHVWGKRRFQTRDTSRNNFILAVITLGEGWHNNHHHYMSSANQGFYWWELDVSYYLLKALSYFGITRDLRKPPENVLVAGRNGLSSNSAMNMATATATAMATGSSAGSSQRTG